MSVYGILAFISLIAASIAMATTDNSWQWQPVQPILQAVEARPFLKVALYVASGIGFVVFLFCIFQLNGYSFE